MTLPHLLTFPVERWFARFVPCVVLAAGTAMAQAPAAAHVSTIVLSSPVLHEGAQVPTAFSCSAGPAMKSPALQWTGVPADAASLVLYLHDLDPHPNGGIDDNLHWLAWNIPASATGVPEDVKAEAGAIHGATQGTNGHNTAGYFGPCPPAGQPDHHYVFEVFALSTKIDLPATASRHEVLAAIDKHIIGHGVMVTLFSRKQ